MNCTYVVAASAVYNAVFCVTDPQMLIPRNSGCYRPMRIIAPAGRVVNVQHPGPVGRRQHRPAAEADRPPARRVRAGGPRARRRRRRGGSSSNLLFGGVHPETGAYYSNYHFDGMGAGGTALQGRQRRRDHAPLELPEHAGRGVRAPLPAAHDRVRPRRRLRRRRRRTAAASRRSGRSRSPPTRSRSARSSTARGSRRRACSAAARAAAPSCSSAAPASDAFRRFDEAFGVASPTKFTNVVLRRGDQLRYVTPGRRRLRRPGRAATPSSCARTSREGYVTRPRRRCATTASRSTATSGT